MKSISLRLAGLLPLLALVLGSCEKEENKALFGTAKAPVLAADRTAVALMAGKEADQAIAFSWTNPDYYFNTGISSHNVNYKLEFGVEGANFTGANTYSTTVTSDLSRMFSVGVLNSILGNDMKLPTGVLARLEARVTASLVANALPQVSNTIKFTATPFAPPPKVALPSSGRLFLVGGATPGGWGNPVPANQEFAKLPNTNNTKFEITVPLTGGGSILMLPVNGSWDDKYGFAGDNNMNVPSGDALRRGGGDIKVPADNGNYKISVDFQAGTFSIVKQ
jgi:starch-binding outer membrane protein SusE/F